MTSNVLNTGARILSVFALHEGEAQAQLERRYKECSSIQRILIQ